MTNASRAPIDFDAFERELARSSSPSQAQPPLKTVARDEAKADPLAELARIVGQDDPFRALLAARDAQAPAAARPAPAAYEAGGRREPTFVEAPARDPQPEPSPADAFDQYLASVEQGEYGRDDHDPIQDPAAFADGEERRPVPEDRPRGRGRLVQVGAGLGVLVLCVTGALTWRGLHGGVGNGEPVTVLADKTPLKVAPTAADGVEIPDQNKQIYDRTAKDGQIKVVNREEQPLDVAQAARAAQVRDAGAAGTTQGGATPNQPGLLTDSLGEPRRVRTVAVKPDTPPPAPQREAAAEPVAAAPPPVPVLTMPEPAPTATPTQAAARPSRALASAPSSPAPSPVQAAPAPAPSRTQAAPAETPALKAPQRVASVAPETTASTLEAPTATKASAASVGGFSVQLGVRNSEGDARAAFRQMQGKFSQLAGKPELIVPAEVNGKSLYRVRVGPLAKAEAASLCTALQGAGGQCFVAKN